MSTASPFLSLANEEHTDDNNANLAAHEHEGRTVLVPTELRPPVNSDAETGNKLLPQNSDLKEAEKDQHAKRPLSKCCPKSQFLLRQPCFRLAPQNENLQKICVPGVTVTDLCHWLSHAPASHTISHVTLHVGVNSCPRGPVSETGWSDFIAMCLKVFPQASLRLSSIIPARGRHNLNNAIVT